MEKDKDWQYNVGQMILRLKPKGSNTEVNVLQRKSFRVLVI